MDWSAFFGAIVGIVVAILVLIGAFLIWDYFDRRKIAPNSNSSNLSVDKFLESHLEEFIVKKFDILFPGWKIFGDDKPSKNSKPKGIRYRTKAGEIDILCVDEDDNFVVIELKRNKAPDRVVAQVDRYIAWVEKELAKSEQTVRGIIIAKSFNDHIRYSVSRRSEIELMVFDWRLELIEQET